MLRPAMLVILGALGALGCATPVGGPAARSHVKQAAPPAPSAGGTSETPTPTPGARVLEVARRMIEHDEVVRGSCYDYVSAVFEEAGYPRERREHVFRSHTEGPYADLSLLQPGDWLALVNHPERDPVGTHSVIFVRWYDATRGEAEVVSYVGGSADRPGDFVTYDVSRTYRVTRALDAAP